MSWCSEFQEYMSLPGETTTCRWHGCVLSPMKPGLLSHDRLHGEIPEFPIVGIPMEIPIETPIETPRTRLWDSGKDGVIVISANGRGWHSSANGRGWYSSTEVDENMDGWEYVVSWQRQKQHSEMLSYGVQAENTAAILRSHSTINCTHPPNKECKSCHKKLRRNWSVYLARNQVAHLPQLPRRAQAITIYQHRDTHRELMVVADVNSQDGVQTLVYYHTF